jgi:hypothetical protein
MVNWLNRQKSSVATATVAVDNQTSRTGWYNRGTRETTTRNSAQEQLPLASRRRGLRYLEVFSLIIVICLIVGVDIYIFNINKRLGALENEFVEARSWAFPASLLESKYTSLNARVRALSEAISGIEAKFAALDTQERQVTTAAPPAADEAVAAGDADISSGEPAAGISRPATSSAADSTEYTGVVSRSEEDAPGAGASPPRTADEQSADDPTPDVRSRVKKPLAESAGVPVSHGMTSDAKPAQRESKGGRWVINLLSDPNAALAERFAVRAHNRGIPVEQNQVEVKGRTVWRVQITGFATAREARAHAVEVKEKLHLKEVWIFKQPG